jgi:hypothetical protein
LLVVQKTRVQKRGVLAFPLFLVTCSAVAFAGCTTTRQSIGGLFSGTTDACVGLGASVYYAGTEGMAVYSEPSAIEVVGRLSLHERSRFKLEQGYAYVQGERGQKGWVDNSLAFAGAPSTAVPITPEPRSKSRRAKRRRNRRQPGVAHSGKSSAAGQPDRRSPGGVAPSIFDAY